MSRHTTVLYRRRPQTVPELFTGEQVALCFGCQPADARPSLRYGTQKVRLGAESLLRFGCCGLCLQRAIKPLAAPSGHIYCKECIYKNLLEQQKKLKIARKRYAAEQAEREARASEARTRAEAESVAAFVASQVPAVRDEDALFTSGVVSASSAGGDDDGAAPSASKEEEEAR